MTELRWEEPPPPSGGRYRYRIVDTLAPLRDNPKRWAHIRTEPSSAQSSNWAQRISNGRFAEMEPGEYEAVARKVDGEYRVYARYVGPPT